MPKFQVHLFHRETGKETMRVVEANSKNEASLIAIDDQHVVGQVFLINPDFEPSEPASAVGKGAASNRDDSKAGDGMEVSWMGVWSLCFGLVLVAVGGWRFHKYGLNAYTAFQIVAGFILFATAMPNATAAKRQESLRAQEERLADREREISLKERELELSAREKRLRDAEKQE